MVVEISTVPGQPAESSESGVGHAKYASGAPPRIMMEVRGKTAYDQLNERELVSFWDHVLYELQNARYDAAIRQEKREIDPIAFGAGRARREAFSTVFHLRSLGRLVRAADDAVAFGNSLGIEARRAIRYADYPGTEKELQQRFMEAPHRASATPGTRYALPSSLVYAYEWLIDQEAGKVAGYIVSRAFRPESDELMAGVVDALTGPVDEDLAARWSGVADRPWKKAKLFLDTVAATADQVQRRDGAIPQRVGSHWNGHDRRKYPTVNDGADGFVSLCSRRGVPAALAGLLPQPLVVVANHEHPSTWTRRPARRPRTSGSRRETSSDS
jgi:hypothetical protein